MSEGTKRRRLIGAKAASVHSQIATHETSIPMFRRCMAPARQLRELFQSMNSGKALVFEGSAGHNRVVPSVPSGKSGRDPQRKLRLAVIGCGAIAETGHLPGARLVPELEVTLLVDKDLSRAERMAQGFGITDVSADVEVVHQHADAAILCLPHHLHCPVAISLMERGVHVLVEKPMALTSSECDRMLEVADRRQVVLAVGLMRRFFRAAKFLKELLLSNLLGKIRRFEIEDGGVYSWASASPFVLSKEHSGGGVLMGNGTHVMDSLIWWFGDPVDLRCRTNALGGMETDALVEVTMTDQCQGTVELSRTRSLGNSVKVWAEKGSVQIPLYGDQVKFGLNGVGLHLEGAAKTEANRESQTLHSVLADQLREFTAAIDGRESAVVTGVESRRSIRLIERCYRIAEPLEDSWSAPFKWV